MSEQPVPQQPDILIQDLEDIPEEPAVQPQPDAKLCARCDAPIPQDETYCENCKVQMQAYPISVGAVIGTVLALLVCLFAVFVLGTNALIARPILEGDKALRADDIKGCYSGYAESYNVADRLNTLLFPHAGKTYFTNGSKTLIKQIRALDRLNGPYQAGQVIDSYFAGGVPKELQDIQAEYNNISVFVTDMQSAVTKYKDTLKPGDTGHYDDMLALVEDCAKKHPETPDYMVDYYRFSVSASVAEQDPARTCAHLDKLIAEAPDALWLYASEGIRAYNENEEYEKSLSICNALMQRDASNTASIGYTMAVLRLLGKYEEALAVYDRALSLNATGSEVERQRAILLMLQGDFETAQEVLVSSYSPQTANLEHVATLAVCAWQNKDTETYKEYKDLLDSYMPYKDVDDFVAGNISLEDIFLSGGGEIQ